MFRQPVRGVRLPLRAFNQSAASGAWRRLFTAPARGRQQLQWRERTLPRVATNTTTGAWKRGFRFSARRQGEAAKKGSDEAVSLSLSQRLKKLSKEYGWAAVGIYLSLSVLDFPFCFLFVRSVGTEAIGKVEHQMVTSIQSVIPEWVQERWRGYWKSAKKAETEVLGNDDITDKVEMIGWGVEKAAEENKEQASLATQLALAYAIHKSFIFLRVPLTAWVTPKVVKVLRSWGWKIGKKRG